MLCGVHIIDGDDKIEILSPFRYRARNGTRKPRQVTFQHLQGFCWNLNTGRFNWNSFHFTMVINELNLKFWGSPVAFEVRNRFNKEPTT